MRRLTSLSTTFGACAALLLAVNGCGPPAYYPVRGKVFIFEAGALTEGEVEFRSLSNSSLIGSGKIKKDGSFSLSTPDHEGLPAGSYRARVTAEPIKGKRPFHERFESFDTSDLQYTVTARQPPDENNFSIMVNRSGK